MPGSTNPEDAKHGNRTGNITRHLGRLSFKVFARKLIKPFGTITLNDVLNELRVVKKFCGNTDRHLVTVYKYGKLRASPYYFIDMELCDTNLDEYIYDKQILGKCSSEFHRTWDIHHIWKIMRDITQGVVFIHSYMEVHRDLKPQNSTIPFWGLLLSLVLYSAEQDTWKVADFGLSAERSSSRTTMSTRFSRGTPSYRAPELLVETPTFSFRVDIWALGCILYELVVKRKAFAGDWAVLDYSVMRQKLVVRADDFVELSALTPLTNLIHQMLEVDPKDRPTARELHNLFTMLVAAGSEILAVENDNPLLTKILQPVSDESDQLGLIQDNETKYFSSPTSV